MAKRKPIRESREFVSRGSKLFGMIAVSILCVVLSAPLKAEGSPRMSGRHGHGHADLHQWYQTLRDPLSGGSCCNGQDCRPTIVRIRNGEIEVKVDGEWIRVPPYTILNVRSPDLNTHVCAPKGPFKPKLILCVILGIGT